MPYFPDDSIKAVSYGLASSGELIIQVYDNISFDIFGGCIPSSPPSSGENYFGLPIHGRVAIDIDNNDNPLWARIARHRIQLQDIYDVCLPRIFGLHTENITSQAIQQAEDKIVEVQVVLMLLSVGMVHIPKAEIIARRNKIEEYHNNNVHRYESIVSEMINPPRSGFSFNILLERPRNDDQDSAYNIWSWMPVLRQLS